MKARKTALFIFAILEFSILLARFATAAWMAVAIISLAVAVHPGMGNKCFLLPASDMFPTEAVKLSCWYRRNGWSSRRNSVPTTGWQLT